jgi:ParB family chromosome partitioning protein
MDLRFEVVPAGSLDVIAHQRKASKPHVERLVSSIERVGFIAPLVVFEQENGKPRYVVVDGQHRFLAAKQLGVKELPVVVVPPEMGRRMLVLNIEKEPNIRERSAVALSLYRELAETQPKTSEDEPLVVDTIEQAHYVTLGLGYEGSGRLAGSSFESILKKCDTFLNDPLGDALGEREKRAKTLLETNDLVRKIAEKLKEIGAWHQFVNAQIIAYANPLKRTRKEAEFDDVFEKMTARLHDLEQKPEKVLGGSA